MGIKVVIAKYNQNEDTLENVSVLDPKVVEFVLSGSKIERANHMKAFDFPFLAYIEKVMGDINVDDDIVSLEIKKGKNINYVIFVPTKTD